MMAAKDMIDLVNQDTNQLILRARIKHGRVVVKTHVGIHSERLHRMVRLHFVRNQTEDDRAEVRISDSSLEANESESRSLSSSHLVLL